MPTATTTSTISRTTDGDGPREGRYVTSATVRTAAPAADVGTPCVRVPMRYSRLRQALALRRGECQSEIPTLSTGGHPHMKLKPLGDRLIVRAIEEEETTASGIVLPDTAKEKPQKGKVIAVGDGRFDDEGEKRIPLDVAEGDEVLYSKYGGTEIKVDGEELLVLRESDVLAKLQ